MSKETVLVVDDSNMIRKSIAKVLLEVGYKVVEAADGADALEVCAEEVPELILLDYRMPALNGKEFLTEIKRRSIVTKVIICSAQSTPSDLVELTRFGACDYLAKPFEGEELVGKVKRALALDESFNIQALSEAPPRVQELIAKATARANELARMTEHATALERRLELCRSRLEEAVQDRADLKRKLGECELESNAKGKSLELMWADIEALRYKQEQVHEENRGLRKKVSLLQEASETESLRFQLVRVGVRLVFLLVATLVAVALQRLDAVSSTQSLIILASILFILLLLPVERIKFLRAKPGSFEATMETNDKKAR